MEERSHVMSIPLVHTPLLSTVHPSHHLCFDRSDPAHDATNVTINSDITLTFNVDVSATNTAFSLTCGSDPDVVTVTFTRTSPDIPPPPTHLLFTHSIPTPTCLKTQAVPLPSTPHKSPIPAAHSPTILPPSPLLLHHHHLCSSVLILPLMPPMSPSIPTSPSPLTPTSAQPPAPLA